MLNNERRIEILGKLGAYILAGSEEWQAAKFRAIQANAWFTEGHIDMAANAVATQFLDTDKLKTWLSAYKLPVNTSKKVGIVMAGNIPLVGFHDLLCGFLSGHELYLKLSSKDEVLLKHLVNKLIEWEPAVEGQLHIADVIKGCDAYIATGSNNTARYFEQYFAKYPHIIRKNRTSVAVIDGTETKEELDLLADDVFSYFGLGCRNVTQVCIPKDYDPAKLMDAFNRYEDIIHHNKYKNNFDYYLAIYLLNKVHYLTNNSVLMVENALPFSAVSVIHYRYYDSKAELEKDLQQSDDIQCIVGHDNTAFGSAQQPTLQDYADGVDTMTFLQDL